MSEDRATSPTLLTYRGPRVLIISSLTTNTGFFPFSLEAAPPSPFHTESSSGLCLLLREDRKRGRELEPEFSGQGCPQSLCAWASGRLWVGEGTFQDFPRIMFLQTSLHGHWPPVHSWDQAGQPFHQAPGTAPRASGEFAQ